MQSQGFLWTIAQVGSTWRWEAARRDGVPHPISGEAPTRAAAAACLIRVIARETAAARS
ncbi:hypothetical protein [Brevundimonas sp.]|uniref:hypothetical protein n=1 Tax=Brevundimonas sp. TaxID=1871086 RepID=UPI0025DF78F0|nr:hypothetical protein [Brevundimonas sp.]